MEGLPEELLVRIASFLDAPSLCRLARCASWLVPVARSADVWRPLFARRFLADCAECSDASPFQLFRAFSGFSRSLRAPEGGRCVALELAPSRRVDHQENAVFQTLPVRGRPLVSTHVVCGGSVPSVTVSRLADGAPTMRFDMASGLAMGLSGDQRTLAAGGLGGQLHVVLNFDPDPRRFMLAQPVRWLKQQLALQRRGWDQLAEKRELVDKLLAAFGGQVPLLSSSMSFDAGQQGLIDVMVEGDTLWTAGWGARISRWRLSNGRAEALGEYMGHTEGVNCVRRRAQDVLMSGGSDGMVKLWDDETLRCTAGYHVSNQWVWCLENHPASSNAFLCGGVDRTVSIYDVRSANRVAEHVLSAEVAGLSVQACNNLVASSCFDGCLRIHDVRRSLELLSRTVVAPGIRLTRCHFLESGVVAGAFDGTARVVSF